MTLKEIIIAYPIITKLGSDVSLPTKIKYKICMLINEIQPSVDFFEKERVEIINKYNTSNNDDIFIPSESASDFEREIEDLISSEFDKDVKKGEISLSVELPITASEMSALIPFFDFVD